MTQMLHYEKELNTPSRLFLDACLKTAHLTALSEFTKSVSGNYNLEIMNAMQNCAAAIAEQNLARLLMGVHNMEKCHLFGFSKRNKDEVLTILRKRKHKNQKIKEFVKRNCNFQHFERNDILFRSNVDWHN